MWHWRDGGSLPRVLTCLLACRPCCAYLPEGWRYPGIIAVDPAESAFSSCTYTVGQLASVMSRCGAFAAASLSSLANGTASNFCRAQNLCTIVSSGGMRGVTVSVVPDACKV